MFERFSEQAKRVMHLADQEARRFGHDHVATEHILLALLRVPECQAARELASAGVELRRVRLEVERLVSPGPEGAARPPGQLPLTPRARQVLERAAAAAERLGHHWVGTEHLLQGLLEEPDGVAYQVLQTLGMAAGQVVTQREPAPAQEATRPTPRETARPRPADAPLESPRAARRDLRRSFSLAGAVKGSLAGLCCSLLVVVPLAFLLWGQPAAGGPRGALLIAGMVAVVWACFGSWIGATRAVAEAMLEDQREVVRTHVRRAALEGALIPAPIALGVLIGLVRYGPGGGPTAAAFLAGLLLPVCIGSAVLLGYARGLKEARWRAEDERRRALDMLGASGALAGRRRTLQRVVEERFGPLGDEARERLKKWDQDQLDTASRRLPDVRSLAELGLGE
jgi:hypothetical protein